MCRCTRGALEITRRRVLFRLLKWAAEKGLLFTAALFFTIITIG